MKQCNVCKQSSGLLVKTCNCPIGYVHLDCGASKSFCMNCGLNYPQEIKIIMKSAKFEVSLRINMMGSVPHELKQLLVIMFEQQILKQERKKAMARCKLRRHIKRIIKEGKLHDAFGSDATKSFTRKYRLKKINLRMFTVNLNAIMLFFVVITLIFEFENVYLNKFIIICM